VDEDGENNGDDNDVAMMNSDERIWRRGNNADQ